MFKVINNEASYLLTIKVNGKKAPSIPYATRQQATKYLNKLLVKFSEHATPIKTDLDQLDGVSIPLSKSTYMIKRA